MFESIFWQLMGLMHQDIRYRISQILRDTNVKRYIWIQPIYSVLLLVISSRWKIIGILLIYPNCHFVAYGTFFPSPLTLSPTRTMHSVVTQIFYFSCVMAVFAMLWVLWQIGITWQPAGVMRSYIHWRVAGKMEKPITCLPTSLASYRHQKTQMSMDLLECNLYIGVT